MKVKYLDLPQQFSDKTLLDAVKKLFETCQFIMGPEVERFEAAFAALCGTRFALGLNSGTDALFLALKALGIGSGDEVITVPNSFIATAGAIVAAGARPVFVDVGNDYNMNPDLIESAVTPHTKAIVPVHLTGNPADMARIIEISRKHRLYVVEDAAQAVTASMNGKRVGSFGDIGCFSLHPLKNLNAAGDAGVLTTDSEEIYAQIKMLRNHGLKNRDEIEFFGYNSRLDTIQAAVANHVIYGIDAVTEKRISNARIYDSTFKDMGDYVTVPPRRDNVRQVFHTYVVQVKDREHLKSYLDSNGIETKIHYPIPIHLQKPCRQWGYKRGDFPVTERQSETILTLPIHQYLTEQQLNYVIETMWQFYKGK
jgi:dTDP-4-amino-4,6-dideoxygalactose transaminase